MVSRSTIVNAVIGAVAAFVLSFVPFSTVLGGAVAGFLEGPNGRDAAVAGALAGAIAAVPFVLFGFGAIVFFGVGLGVAGFDAAAIGFLALIAFASLALAAVLIYTVGFSALGGLLGAYIAEEYPGHHADARETIGFPPEYDRDGRRRAGDGRQADRRPRRTNRDGGPDARDDRSTAPDRRWSEAEENAADREGER